MGMQVSFGFGNFRLILRVPEGHTTGGGTDDGHLTEAVLKDSQGTVLGSRVFHDALDLVKQLCPGVAGDKHPPSARTSGEPEDRYMVKRYVTGDIKLEVSPAAMFSGEQPSEEIDVDLGDDLDLLVSALDPSDTIPDGMEYLGTYCSIPAFLRAMLEPEVTPACAWILDHLDYQAVQRRWESDGSRLMLELGHVYRLRAPSPTMVSDPSEA